MVRGRLPGLNELLNKKATSGGNGWNAYNALKCQWYGQIALLVRGRGIGAQAPGYGTFLFLEPSRQRDPDNIVAGGVKLLLDSLVGCEVLPGDGWGNNLGFIGYWELTPGQAGCLIHWDNEILSKASMLELCEEEKKKHGNSSYDQKRTGPGASRHAGLGADHSKAARRRA